jgi:predicted nucleotidyltransferase component of viral defense system
MTNEERAKELSTRLKVENKKRSLKHQLHRKLRRRLEISEGALSPSWILWLLFPVLMFRKFMLKGGN